MDEAAGQEFSFQVDAKLHRERADKAVTARAEGLSRSAVQKLFAAGLVWREDAALSQKDKVLEGDWITYTVPPPRPLELRPVDIPLDVIYEDAECLAIHKPAGMVVHPGAGTGEDTLVHALLHHCRGQLSGIGGVERPGIVHRLDRETSGVIIMAKTDRAHQALSRQFAERQTDKRYLALVQGVPRDTAGKIDAPIGRHPVHRQKMAIVDHGRYALTDYFVEEAFGEVAARVRFHIHTGRTHQIRVHAQHLGYPLAGDPMYGFRANAFAIEVPRVMLHAAELRIAHPTTGEPLVLQAPLPADFEALQGALRGA
ncbi:MAG: RluA family pseudouridine synthase [Verrucomicrobiota bacterium JB022]|nr:RluA family pseudouridine synthase [Verrucomicrobiota bacterium JB022]